MPYESVADVPDNVPKAKRKQWLEVWNSSYKEHHDESRAFASAWAAIGGKDGKSALVVLTKAAGTTATGFVRAVEGPFRCGHCAHMVKEAGAAGYCVQPEVNADPQLKDEPRNDDGYLLVAGGDCSNEYDPVATISAEKAKSMSTKFQKFIPFIKVDAARREVWGVVTAEVPDKDDEVCDYEGSKPYYQAVITEMQKATDGKNCFPLREMHQLSAVGKGIGFEFRDPDKEIFMGFKVVDDDAWKKVDEGVYTGFSQGGSIVGDLKPDPVFKGCKRYVADPSEVSLVDNPCLGAAHFAYVKADGQLELRKFKKTEDATIIPSFRLQSIIESVEQLKKAKHQPVTVVAVAELGKKEKKKDGVKYLVTDDEGYGYLPYTGSDGKPDHRLMGAAWAALHGGYRGKQYEGPDKSGAVSRLKGIYEKEGMETPSEKVRKALEVIRKSCRVWTNRHYRKISDIGMLRKLDNDLGYLTRKQDLQKGMYEVSQLACSIQNLAWLVYGVAWEQEMEQDESAIPAQLAENVSGLLDTLLAYTEEEVEELREELRAKV